MEPSEFLVNLSGIIYALTMLGVIMALKDQMTEIIVIGTVFTLVFSCPFFWCIIRAIRDWDKKRKQIVVVEKKKKKKPDIAMGKEKIVLRTQAEILEEQRQKALELNKVSNIKLKKQKSKKKVAPKRKGP